MIYELSIIHKSQIINQNSFLFQFTIIDHMFGFTHTPLDAARLDNPYIVVTTITLCIRFAIFFFKAIILFISSE